MEGCFQRLGFYIQLLYNCAQSKGVSPLHLSQPLIYLEDNVKFNQKTGKTEQLNFKDGEPREPVALKA